MLIILKNALDFGRPSTSTPPPVMPGNVAQEGPTCLPSRLPHEALAFASRQTETAGNVCFCFQLACLRRLQRN